VQDKKVKRTGQDKERNSVGMNLFLASLLILLVVQCCVYMRQYSWVRSTTTEIPFDMRMLYAGYTETPRTLNPSLLAPEAVAVNNGTVCRAVFHSAAVIEEIYAEINECLLPALSAEPVPANAAEWESALSGRFVFAKFSHELPYQVLCAFSAAQTESGEQVRKAEAYVGVRELLISADETGTLLNVYLRGEAGCSRFPLTTDKNAGDFENFMNAYSEYFCPVTFSDHSSYTVLETSDDLYARSVHVSGDVTSLLNFSREFLRFFDFNPDKLNYHTEPDGTFVYVESHGILRSSSDEMLYQASERGGIDISGMVSGKADDIYAYLSVASLLISRLEEMDVQYIGDDASLYLESVSVKGSEITLKFSFRCDNILLFDENSHGLTLTFSEDKLTNISYRMQFVRKTSENRRILLQSWYRQMLDAQDADIRLVYVPGVEANVNTAVWAVRQPAAGGEGDAVWDGQD